MKWNDAVLSLTEEEIIWIVLNAAKGDQLALSFYELDEYMVVNQLDNPSDPLVMQFYKLISKLRKRMEDDEIKKCQEDSTKEKEKEV